MNAKICGYSKYRKIFCNCFNISFGNPRTDTCSLCEKMNLKIKAVTVAAEKQACMTEKRVHKLRAMHFFELLRMRNSGEKTVYFDKQQNQPLPKLSVSEVFYARQVWLYSLTVMTHEEKQTADNTNIYTWLETEAGRGANEVVSSVQHFLHSLDEKEYNNGHHEQTLRLRIMLLAK